MVTWSEAQRHNAAMHEKLEGNIRTEANREVGFDEFLQMKTLAKKRHLLYGNPLGTTSLELALADQGQVRNLCIRLNLIRMAELDALVEVLGCTKQEYLLEMLASSMIKTQRLFRLHGLEQEYSEALDRQFEKTGYTVELGENGFYQQRWQGKLVKNTGYEEQLATADAVNTLIKTKLETSTDGEN